MLTKTVDAFESQAVLTKAIPTLEAGAILTETVAALEHAEIDMVRPDDHLRAEESKGARSDGADFERLQLEDKDRQVPTTEGDALDHDGSRDKVAKPAYILHAASLSCTRTCYK